MQYDGWTENWETMANLALGFQNRRQPLQRLHNLEFGGFGRTLNSHSTTMNTPITNYYKTKPSASSWNARQKRLPEDDRRGTRQLSEGYGLNYLEQWND